MTGTGSVAVRRNGAVPAQQDAALAIRPGQTTWDKYQEAALTQIGLADASNADRAVFLHQCQRTGLDPFARQIYMIPRPEKVPGTRDQWRTKWTIQTGIEGWRVIRDRAEKREGVRGNLSRALWYDEEGNEYKVWVRREPPAACELTYTVRDASGVETPYTSVLQFWEYAQTKEINGQVTLISQWVVKKSHMLEKCTEADVYRKAFPQDFSGIYLDDAMPSVRPEDMTGEELDAAARAVGYRQRVTAEQARASRQPQRVASEVVSTTPDVPPAPAAPAPQGASAGQVTAISDRLRNLGYGDGDEPAMLRATAKLAGYDGELNDPRELSADQAASVLRQLQSCTDATQLDALLNDGEVPGND